MSSGAAGASGAAALESRGQEAQEPLRELDALRCPTAMNEERNKAVVARFAELGNGTGDPDTLDELCTPDRVNHALAARR